MDHSLTVAYARGSEFKKNKNKSFFQHQLLIEQLDIER